MTPRTTNATRQQTARALWYTHLERAEIRTESLPSPGPGEATVATRFSAISRGTERLVFSGSLDEAANDTMRAPMQEGMFPYPVKYGYCVCGQVETGPANLLGRHVFALHPHQDRFVVPADVLTPVPDDVPPKRATLAANMETALNAHWDAQSGPGQKICVVGAGTVGLLVAFIAALIPGAEVIVVDNVEARCELAHALGATFAHPKNAPENCDIVFHTSATSAGLQTAIHAAGFEAVIVELSWYGNKTVSPALGTAFHHNRLKLISSQVGSVAARQRGRWTHRRRLEKAVELLHDDRLDALVEREIPFEEAPIALKDIMKPGASELPPVLAYRNDTPPPAS